MTFLTKEQEDALGSAVSKWRDSLYAMTFHSDTTRVDDFQSLCVCIPRVSLPTITKVIFNSPATIVYWDDGTKTVVKCGKNDVWDAEKGLAMAVTKKAMGNKGNYNRALKKWLEADK